jgi:arsenate reductase
MAEGLARHLKSDEIEAYSVGTQPKGLNPLAVEVMQEIGIDISRHTSKHLKELADIKFDYVITLCGSAHESCPVLPGSKILHYGFSDPPELAKNASTKEAKLAFYRQVRDQIRDFVVQLPQILTTGRI